MAAAVWRLLPGSPPMLLAPTRRVELLALLRSTDPAAQVASDAQPVLPGRGLPASPPAVPGRPCHEHAVALAGLLHKPDRAVFPQQLGCPLR